MCPGGRTRCLSFVWSVLSSPKNEHRSQLRSLVRGIGKAGSRRPPRGVPGSCIFFATGWHQKGDVKTGPLLTRLDAHLGDPSPVVISGRPLRADPPSYTSGVGGVPVREHASPDGCQTSSPPQNSVSSDPVSLDPGVVHGRPEVQFRPTARAQGSFLHCAPSIQKATDVSTAAAMCFVMNSDCVRAAEREAAAQNGTEDEAAPWSTLPMTSSPEHTFHRSRDILCVVNVFPTACFERADLPQLPSSVPPVGARGTGRRLGAPVQQGGPGARHGGVRPLMLQAL